MDIYPGVCVLLQRYKLALVWFCLNLNSELSSAVAQTNVAPKKRGRQTKGRDQQTPVTQCTQKVQSGVF